MKTFMALVASGMVVAAAVGADKPLSWPRFRGPGGSGVAEGQKPPVEFGREKNVRWKVAVPSGLSSPIVAGDNLVLTASENGKLYTIAYRRADGREAWRREAPAKEIERFHKSEGSPAASTPATDGERIVVYFGSCGLLCYDLTGKEQWKVEHTEHRLRRGKKGTQLIFHAGMSGVPFMLNVQGIGKGFTEAIQ